MRRRQRAFAPLAWDKRQRGERAELIGHVVGGLELTQRDIGAGGRIAGGVKIENGVAQRAPSRAGGVWNERARRAARKKAELKPGA